MIKHFCNVALGISEGLAFAGYRYKWVLIGLIVYAMLHVYSPCSVVDGLF